MPTQDFYARGDKQVVNNFIEELEDERDLIETAFQAVEDRVASVPEYVEHDVDFGDHAAPRPPQFRTRASLATLTAFGGAVAVGAAAPPVAPGATFDLLVGGVSILTAPIPGAALLPGVLVPLSFVAVAVATPGAKIEFVWSDGGAPSFDVSANVQWLRT